MKRWYALVFLLGFVSCAFLFCIFSYSGIRVLFGTGLVTLDEVAPSDWVSEKDIIVLSDRVILRVENATLSDYAATGSMKPLFDIGANGIRIIPKSEGDISIGDIVSFDLGGELVVHQIIRKGVDGDGVYFVTRGSNSLISDGKIRFWDIKYVTIGVIW